MKRLVVGFLVCLVLVGCLGVFVPQVYAYTGTITYSAANDKITLVGGTSGSPITFADILAADVAGGWGQVSKQGDLEYMISCRLQIGNGSTTYFTDSLKQIVFASGVVNASSDILVNIYNSATVTFGIVVNATSKSSYGGCS